MSAPPPKIPRTALVISFARAAFLQSAWNVRGMQNLGFAWAMAPGLRALYPNPAAQAAAHERHLEHFNCHPYMAAALVGAALHVEEQIARGQAAPEAVGQLKRTLGPPFAAVGDGFFWSALRPAAALIAILTAPRLGLWSAALFVGTYNGVHLPARLWLFRAGYARGPGMVNAVSHLRFPRATHVLKEVAAVSAGTLAALVVLRAGFFRGNLRLWGSFVAVAAALGFWAALPKLGLRAALALALGAGLALGAAFL